MVHLPAAALDWAPRRFAGTRQSRPESIKSLHPNPLIFYKSGNG